MCNAYAAGVVRAIKEECLNKGNPARWTPSSPTVAEFVAHYHGERNHQGIGNALIDP